MSVSACWSVPSPRTPGAVGPETVRTLEGWAPEGQLALTAMNFAPTGLVWQARIVRPVSDNVTVGNRHDIPHNGLARR